MSKEKKKDKKEKKKKESVADSLIKEHEKATDAIIKHCGGGSEDFEYKLNIKWYADDEDFLYYGEKFDKKEFWGQKVLDVWRGKELTLIRWYNEEEQADGWSHQSLVRNSNMVSDRPDNLAEDSDSDSDSDSD